MAARTVRTVIPSGKFSPLTIDHAAMAAVRARRDAPSGARDLSTIRSTFRVSPRELGKIFGVSRQAVDLWADAGVPAGRLAELGRVADVARRLHRTFKPDRIPAIVQQPNPGLDGRSVLETLAEPAGSERVMHALDRLLSFVPPGSSAEDL